MNRSAKQFVYGFFYLAILVLIAFLIYGLFLKPAPTCFDKIQNQGETGIDCGGPCSPCGSLALQLPQIKKISFFSTAAGQVVVLADVLNPNPDYGASSVDYQLMIYDKSSQLMTTLGGSEFFRPAEEKYIFSADIKTDPKDISRVDIVFSNPNWQAGGFSQALNVKLVGSLKTVVVGSGIQVTGTVVNQGPWSIADLKVIAILSDKFGLPIFASQSLIADVPGGAERPLFVSFPSDLGLNAKFNASATQVFFSGQ